MSIRRRVFLTILILLISTLIPLQWHKYGVDGPPHPKTAKNYVADDNRTAKKALPKIAPAPAASAKQP
jgi:hypothetical protein